MQKRSKKPRDPKDLTALGLASKLRERFLNRDPLKVGGPSFDELDDAARYQYVSVAMDAMELLGIDPCR